MKTPQYSGIITNYNCTASCRHCMFASSPSCPKEYITAEMSEKIAALLEEAGTYSVHIGGGEPFMDFSALCGLISALNRHGVEVDYIETNAFWCRDEKLIRERLGELRSLGVTTVMASVDPFHIEFVPLERPLLLCNTLSDMGMDYFIWQERFLRRLAKLDITKTHSREELEAVLGENYIVDTAAEYGLGMNGRALKIAKSIYGRKSVEEILSAATPCSTLLVPNHCHIDLYGNAIPSRCTGIAIPMRDYLEGRIAPEKYPVMHALVSGGVNELYEYAISQGFVPDSVGYATKCALCCAMREYLLRNSPSADIAPTCFYENMEVSLSE